MAEIIYMIHGMMGGSWCWDDYAVYFQRKGYSCIAPTLRYHDIEPGDTPDPRLGVTGLLDYVDDLEKEIKQLDQRPIIMGHSMGGLLAQILGSRGLAKALVLLTPAAPYGINVLRYSVIKSFSGFMVKWGFWKKPFRIPLNTMVYGMMNRLPAHQQKEIYDKLVYESGRAAFQIGMWYLDGCKSSRVDYKKVSCPVLFVAAKEDRVTPPPLVRENHKKYASTNTADYWEYENHDHWLIAEPGWENIAGDIGLWLEEKLGKPVSL